MSSRKEEDDKDGYVLILDDFRKNNRVNRRSCEGDMAFTRWVVN